MTIYLDCNATTPMEPEVRDLVLALFAGEYGNPASRTHEFGLRSKQAVEKARGQVAAVVASRPDEVYFTSGATESNNIALLGLAAHGEQVNRRHIVTTTIEHKAVLEPLEVLEKRGFEVTRIAPGLSGRVAADEVAAAMRGDTLAVSVMHVNNETGIVQPIAELAGLLAHHDAYFHVDAAQGFGKDLAPLREGRIDLISATGHKIYGPVGIGTLVARRRGYSRPPIQPLLFGGGQERGLRPGTLPTALVAGFGLAAELAVRHHSVRRRHCETVRREALRTLALLGLTIHGDTLHTLPHVISFSIHGLDSEAIMLTLKGVAAVSNGSACTSQSYTRSHVLASMGLPDTMIDGAIRLSWSHLTPDVDWDEVAGRIAALL